MTTDPTSLGSAAEYQVTIDFGGRDGVHVKRRERYRPPSNALPTEGDNEQ
jgi:hypothetical protein